MCFAMYLYNIHNTCRSFQIQSIYYVIRHKYMSRYKVVGVYLEKTRMTNIIL
jgi:hypothetical protein